jgi:hypothetical protein
MSIVYCNAQYFMNHNNFKKTEMGVMHNGWGQKGKGERAEGKGLRAEG